MAISHPILDGFFVHFFILIPFFMVQYICRFIVDALIILLLKSERS